MKSAFVILLTTLVALAGNPAARAADVSPQIVATKPHAEDEAAIRAAGAAFIEAYNARDAKKLATLWSPEAVYVDAVTGEETIGRAAIEKVFAEAFADNQDIKFAAEPKSIDFVSPNVAIIQGTAHVIRPDGESSDSEFTAVRVKREGKWLLDRVSEIEREKLLPSSYEHLKELEWLIGSWHDADTLPSIEIQTDCEWAKNKNFITRSFAIAIGDRVNKSGMQIIGWDPATKQIRSWVFDSDGGFAEGTWTHKGKQWFVQTAGIQPDGSKATSENIMTVVDDDTFKLESVNREVDGELQPNVAPVLVVRKSGQ